MSIGGELEAGNGVPEVRRVRWRYVKGGLRRVIFLCVGGGLVSCWAACDDDFSVEIDAILEYGK